MGLALLVDTGKVESTAQQIAKINRNISDDFLVLEEAINKLNHNWEGSASDYGINAYRNIKKNFYDSRHGVVNNLVSLMNNQVGVGYNEMEKSISSATSAFK